MRLPSVLLAVSAATLLASGSALSADANQGTKVSVMASPDLGVLDVSLNAGDEKRSLRGLKVVDEEDEERLAGANMFSIEKLTKAMGDANYAKTLMRRWKRHGIEIKDAKKILENSSVGKNPKLNVVYRNYAAWLDKHFPLGAETTGGKNLFSKAKIDQALEDSKYAKTLFGRWKSHGYESDDVFTKLKTMGLKIGDGTLDKMYRNYLSWLNVHHPDNETIKLAVGDDLFKESMLQRARGDDLYAESLFRAWKTKGLDVPENLKSTLGNVDNTLLEKYNTWLQTHFPRKYVQRRTMIKDYCPGMLDPMTGGVVQFGEHMDVNAEREAEEEMGVKNTPVRYLTTFCYGDDRSRVWGGLFDCTFDGPLVLQDEEVDEVLTMTGDEILARRKEFTPDGIFTFEKYLKFIEDER